MNPRTYELQNHTKALISTTNMTISISKSRTVFSFILITQHATTVYETHVLSRVIYWWHVVGTILLGKS